MLSLFNLVPISSMRLDNLIPKFLEKSRVLKYSGQLGHSISLSLLLFLQQEFFFSLTGSTISQKNYFTEFVSQSFSSVLYVWSMGNWDFTVVTTEVSFNQRSTTGVSPLRLLDFFISVRNDWWNSVTCKCF